jgi:hypothetical protein
MTCPDCQTTISARHFDPEYEWYECPACHGCFTPPELGVGSAPAKPQEARSDAKIKKSLSGKGLVAKGKLRRTEIADDEAALAEFEKKMFTPTARQEGPKRHRDEVSTKEVVNIMADELVAIYDEEHTTLSYANAQDKALILWRELHFHGNVPAREKSMTVGLCSDHE